MRFTFLAAVPERLSALVFRRHFVGDSGVGGAAGRHSARDAAARDAQPRAAGAPASWSARIW
jgi:hypothetical protein